MDVYYDNNLWGKGRSEARLIPLPLNRSFCWEGQEILIPAVYTGRAGVVLDICAKIPTEEMENFLKKWNYERRTSLKTQEEFEQIDADNPGSREFAVELSLDDIPLQRRMSSSLRWYPDAVIRLGKPDPDSEDKYENDQSAEEWMDAYHCDRTCCWYFERLSYQWKGAPILLPAKISLAFRAGFLSVPGGHFATGASCGGATVKTTHPITGQEYTLTLHESEQTRHSFAEIGAKGVVYPEYCRILSYSISPEIDPALFDVRDCAEGDHPRRKDSQEKPGRPDGPTAAAVFMAGKNAAPDKNKRAAVSSLHFEPVTDVQWRMVFQIKPKGDIEVSFPIKPAT